MNDANPTVAAIQQEAADKTRLAYLKKLYETTPDNAKELYELGAAIGVPAHVTVGDIEFVRQQAAAATAAAAHQREEQLTHFKAIGLSAGESQLAASMSIPARGDGKGEAPKLAPHYTQMVPRQPPPLPVTREERIASYKVNGLSEGEAIFAADLDLKK